MSTITWKDVHWSNSLFLGTTLFLTLTAVPAYIWAFGLSPFQVALFLVFFLLTGLSITLGYHRLFSHLAFQASWPVRLGTLLFGAAAFENSALFWAADHRRHHKFVDHENDPYDITKGFFHAHIGWILFKYQLDPPLDGVKDLLRDRLVQWQHRHYVMIAVAVGFLLPTLIGLAWNGWVGALGGFLIAGVARVVFVHHMTFCINSLCHWIGRRPYSSRCTARDSGLMAIFTFGEGYHNYHHEFQHDYRNGVKPWQFDPTKWSIWLLHKLGLARQLRRVPTEKILLAQITEQKRQLAEKLQKQLDAGAEAHPIQDLIASAHEQLQEALKTWERCRAEYGAAVQRKVELSKQSLAELRAELREANVQLQEAIREWRRTHKLVQAALG